MNVYISLYAKTALSTVLSSKILSLSSRSRHTQSTLYGGAAVVQRGAAASRPGIVGPQKSSAVVAAGVVAALESLPMLSPTATSSVFSDKTAYTTFSRLQPSNTDESAAVLAVVRKYNW